VYHWPMLPFSKRTTTAVTVFACLQASKAARLLTAAPTTLGSLSLEQAALFHVYRKVLHQDVANQATVLDGIIAQAATAIGNLNTTVRTISVPQNQDQAIQLADLQLLTSNAVQVMMNVVNAE
jgi:hypothetical protein